MGSSITVHHLGGPRTVDVDAILSQFAGGRFDGSIDLATRVSHWLSPDGIEAVVALDAGTVGSRGMQQPEYNDRPSLEWELVRFGADYIHSSREPSADEFNAAKEWLEGIGFDVARQPYKATGLAHVKNANVDWDFGQCWEYAR